METRESALRELTTLKQRIRDIEAALSRQHEEPAVPLSSTTASALSAAVPMDATRIVMHQIVAPTEVDALGICTGGQVLSWIDVCAGLSAKTLARGPCVTISVDAVHFFRPCRRGDVVIIAAMVNRTFNSSMEVGVRVEAEDMRTGSRRHCCSAYLTFVSLRGRGGGGGGGGGSADAAAPTQAAPPRQPLPRVLPGTAEHARIHAQAEARRQQRLAERHAAVDDPQLAAVESACRLKPITHREGCPSLPPALTLLPPQRGSLDMPRGTSTPAEAAAAARSSRSSDPGDGSSCVQTAVSAPPKRRVPPSSTTAYMTVSVMPQHANTLGLTFGGQILSWMEQCSYIAASRLRGWHLLTAGMDSVRFAASTRVGDVLYITAQVTAIFSSSLEVMVSVYGESPTASPGPFHCADAFATVVVVGQEGGPQAVPFELAPATATEQLRCQGAVARRSRRLAMRSAMAAASSVRPSLDGTRPRSGESGSSSILMDDAVA